MNTPYIHCQEMHDWDEDDENEDEEAATEKAHKVIPLD